MVDIDRHLQPDSTDPPPRPALDAALLIGAGALVILLAILL